jgi:DNA-binding transcriptional MerR regulator
MLKKAFLQPSVIRTDRGLSIAGTRITLYQIIDCLKGGMSISEIRDIYRLTIKQISDVMEYIEKHHSEVEVEYQQVIEQAEKNKQYWENRNRERFEEIAKMTPKQEYKEVWERLQEWKKRIAQSS